MFCLTICNKYLFCLNYCFKTFISVCRRTAFSLAVYNNIILCNFFCIAFQGGLEIPVISLTVLVVVKAMVSVMELTEIYQNVTVKMWVLCIKQIYSFRICKRCHKDKQRVWGRIKNTSQKKNMVQSSIYSGADTLFCYMSISINSSFNYTIFVYVLI